MNKREKTMEELHKVLIVDDEKLVRDGLVRSVDWRAYGLYCAGSCADGLSGLDAVHTLSPDLVICDIRMPKMTGLEMMQRLRKEGNDVEVIFLTAYSDFTYARDALRLLAADYLLKPFEDEEFDEALRKVIRRRNWKIPERERCKEPILPEIGTQSAIDPSLRDPVTKNVYCLRAMQVIKNHYGEKSLSVSTVADALGISDGYLSRVFRAGTGITPAAYITMVRMRNAKNLLRMHTYKVYEVADLCGYTDITYFSSTFKKVVGMSPTKFQNEES